eukprot:629978-Amphidinium_carterae.2
MGPKSGQVLLLSLRLSMLLCPVRNLCTSTHQSNSARSLPRAAPCQSVCFRTPPANTLFNKSERVAPPAHGT